MNLEKEVKDIKERNKKVAADKAWETSVTRRILIAATTYFVMVLVMHVLKLSDPFIGALIPTLGFLLSTLGVTLVKRFWIQRVYREK